MMDSPRLLWQPRPEDVKESNLYRYQHYICKEYNIELNSYDDLWIWSNEHSDLFWPSLFKYFELVYEGDLEPAYTGDVMPDITWFDNIRLNLAENLTRYSKEDKIALVETDESGGSRSYSWGELLSIAATIQQQLYEWGLVEGDRVCGVLPNNCYTTAAFLAVSASGFIWSCCSPEFGVESILDRFGQVKPKVLLCVDQYSYGGKSFTLKDKTVKLVEGLNSVEFVLNLSKERGESEINQTWIADFDTSVHKKLKYNRVSFSTPLWILYSSGTTGIPKAITHCHGGVLLELQKYHAFHNNVKPGEMFFWYSTTGWMMWNYLHGAWLMDAKVLLYDGSPGYPEVDFLWKLAEKFKINHFGTSAPYIMANKKAGLELGKKHDLSLLKSIGSTGSPLPSEGFDYVYESIKQDVWLCSMSGGTDVCTAFVGGNPTLPVYEGEIQSRALGCSLYCLDEAGNKVYDQEGEMVITQAMPCMPIYFWNDEGKERYQDSYFGMYPHLWRHGDWIKITPRNGIIIYGRSDATLNRQGIRIGTSEIYRGVDHIPEVLDSLIVHIEKGNGDHWMPLFVILQEGVLLSDDIKKRINKQLRTDYSPRHVPDEIIQVSGIPYTLSGKKMENPIKRLLSGIPPEKCFNPDTIRNPESLEYFYALAKKLKDS